METVNLNIHNLLQLEIHTPSLGKQLTRLKSNFGTDKNSKPSVLTILKKPLLCKGLKPFSTGSYRGIRWELYKEGSNDAEQFYFYTPAFLDFLLMRVVLLPLLKGKIIQKGGGMLIGSAFCYSGSVFFCVGEPRSGKTELLLEALANGGSVLGDDELLVFPDGKITSAFGELQIRLSSAKNSAISKHLSPIDKSQIWLYEVLSQVSFKKINLALTYPLQTFSLPTVKTFPADLPKTVILLGQSETPQEGSVLELISFVENYERKYQAAFGSAFITPQEVKAMGTNLRSLFVDTRVISAPAHSSLGKLSQLLQTKHKLQACQEI